MGLVAAILDFRDFAKSGGKFTWARRMDLLIYYICPCEALCQIWSAQ